MEQEKQSNEENPHLNDDKDNKTQLENTKTESELNAEKPAEEKKDCEQVPSPEKSEDKCVLEKSENKENSESNKSLEKPAPHESPGTSEQNSPTDKTTGENSSEASASATSVDSALVNTPTSTTSTTLSTDSTASSSSSSNRYGDNNRTYSSYKDIEKDLDIEDCLMTKVILYSLQNKLTVDNSRLDMAKNKYMMNSTNNNSLFSGSSSSSNSSNSSDTNLSNNSTKVGIPKNTQQPQTKVDQIVNEFKGGGKSDGNNAEAINTIDNSKVNTTSDNTDKNKCKESDLLSNGADSIKLVSEKSTTKSNTFSTANNSVSLQNDNVQQNKSPSVINLAENSSESSKTSEPSSSNNQSSEAASSNSNTSSNKSNDNLDFRDTSADKIAEKPPDDTATLDLTITNREKTYDDKSVPPIKRNHALYVGIPDFSKPIFTAPTISKTTTSLSNQPNKTGGNGNESPLVVPKMKTPDFTSVARALGTSELQMRKPDFSNCFSPENKSDNTASNNVPVNEKNLAEICRKNNYISDLQLKPPSSPHPPPLTSSYKIDYRPTAPQNLIQNEPSNQVPRRDSITDKEQSQQILIDEPMAHIIHKNQFLPPKTDAGATTKSANPNWTPHLLGGSSSNDATDTMKSKPSVLYNMSDKKEMDSRSHLPSSSHANSTIVHTPSPTPSSSSTYATESRTTPVTAKHGEEATKASYTSPLPQQSNYLPNTQEDLRKYNPAHYPYMPKDKQYIRSIEQQERSKSEAEFSLKQKEHQLRQEGTIITIKNESAPLPAKQQLLPNSIENRDVSRSSNPDPSRLPKESDYYREYKLKQNVHEYVPSKNTSTSSIIQHTGNTMPQSSRQSTEASPYSEYQKPNVYSHPPQTSSSQHNDYRYDPTKQAPAGAFKPVERSPVPSSVIYSHPNDLRGLPQNQNIKHSTSPVFHSQPSRDTRSENYYAPSSSSSSRSYGSPSPVHGYPHQHPHGRSPVPVHKVEGQMHPPQNWPPMQASSQMGRVVASPVDRNNPGLLTSPSPTNVLHPSPKPSPSPIQSPVHHSKASPSPHSNPNPYSQSTSQSQSYAKYSTNYPTKYPEYQDNKDFYAKTSFHPQQQPQKYPESHSIQYGDFSRHFEDRRKYPNTIDTARYSSQESLNKNMIKENMSQYGGPSNEYHHMRHASSDTNLNQSGARHSGYPESHLRKSETDLNSRESAHHNIDPSRQRVSDSQRLQFHHSESVDYKPNLSYNPAVTRKDMNSPQHRDRNFGLISTAGLKTASTLEIRPVESQKPYGTNYPSTANYTDRRGSDIHPADLATISKVKVETRPTERTTQVVRDAAPMSKVSSSVFVPVKRESPLDLSVKTVKTKADSTGCDDLSSTSRSAPYLHKVEFTPNFGQHPERRDIPPRHQPTDLVARQPVNDTSHRIQNIMQKDRMNVIQTQQVSHLRHASPQLIDPNASRVSQPLYGEPSRKQDYHHNMPPLTYPDRHHAVNNPIKDPYEIQPRSDQRYMDTGRPQAPIINGPVPEKYERNTYPQESKHIVVNPELHRPGTSGMPVGNYADACNKIEEAKIAHPNYNNQHIYKASKSGESSQSALPPQNPTNFPVDHKRIINNNPKFDLDTERRNDRELVENILYNRKRNSVLEMQAAQNPPPPPTNRPPGQYDSRRPISPNRKRPSEIISPQIPMPAKLPRVEESPHLRRLDHMSNSHSQLNYAPKPNIIKNEGSPYNPSNHPQGRMLGYNSPHQHPYNMHDNSRQPPMPKRESNIADNKYYSDPRYPVKEQSVPKHSINTPPPLAPSAMPPYRFGAGQYYPNPKAEMINRNDSRQSVHYNKYSQPLQQQQGAVMPERLPYPQQNFYSRPDDAHFKGENVPPPSHLNNKYPNYPYANKQQTIISENVIKVDHISGQKIGDQKTAIGIPPHFTNLTSSSNMGSNGNIARGADQNTISKLRNSLEQKELQKLKSQKSMEISEDENKTDTSPRQFRTKGELKGFNPLPFDAQKTVVTNNAAIENVKFEEPMNLHKDNRENRIDSGTPSAFDIMDWGSACNDFVEQLQTGKKRSKRKRYTKKNETDFKIEIVDKPIPFSELPGSNANISEVPIDIVKSVNKDVQDNSSSEDEKPLHLLRQQSSNNNGQDSNSGRSDKLSEKSSRDYREKQRMDLAQRIAARLGKPSSSESESESRRPPRTKVKVRRLRTRSSIGLKNTSDENSAEEEETDEDDADKNKTLNLKKKKVELDTSEEEAANVKTKINNAISKLEELTSSESEHETSTKKVSNKINENNSKNSEKKASGETKKSKDSDTEPKANPKNLKAKKSNNTKTADSKKPKESTSSSESEESDDDKKKTDKKSKPSMGKVAAAKKKSSGNDSGIKKLLQEEETMTRSKRKLEIEKKLSNSKVLRNDKVVQNIAPDRKKHAEAVTTKKTATPTSIKKNQDSKRKIIGSESEDTSKPKSKNRRVSKLSSTEEESEHEEVVTERLRPRKSKVSETTDNAGTKGKDKEKQEKPKVKTGNNKTVEINLEEKSVESISSKPSLPCKIPLYPLFREDKGSRFAPGWEIETYNYKRSLKVPANLISIGRPPLHGISYSLPDLDPQSSDTSETFSEFHKKIRMLEESKKEAEAKNNNKKGHGKANRKKSMNDSTTEPSTSKETKSIIDLLHERYLNSKRLKSMKFIPSKLTKSTPAKNEERDNKADTSSNKKGEKVIKKNIFETFILKSRTRTENKNMKCKESVREVFGVEDRPSSAPPTFEEPEPEKFVSFDQKYREYLEGMNVDFGDKPKKILPIKKQNYEKVVPPTSIKVEKMDEDSIQNVEEDDDDNETVRSMATTIKEENWERDLVTPTPITSLKIKAKKGRGIRTGRRKGSSGFDYIRKKKKPPQHGSENSAANIIRKRMAAMENLQEKDENDIGKEIKGWVLNKGVGESALHKAARLGYIDVIAYCLDRLDMNPDPKDNAGYTPLHEACSKGHLDIARLLLQFGANHSETAHSGIRPLHEAVENGYIEVVRLLLAHGADPCLATYAGQTPIMLAENDDMIQFLKSYLIDLNNDTMKKTNWKFEGPWRTYDSDEYGCDVFADVTAEKPDSTISSMVSTLSTSTTSLITATTQMSDNEMSMTSENITPIKTPSGKLLTFENKLPAPNNNNNNNNSSNNNNNEATPNLLANKFSQKMKKCDTNSNNIMITNSLAEKDIKTDKTDCETNKGNKTMKNCTVVLNNIDPTVTKKTPKKSINTKRQDQTEEISATEPTKKEDKEDFEEPDNENFDESDGERFEIEESESPLPPLYLLKDEGTDRWILLSDLCNLLKVKSKDAVLKQICPTSPPSSVNKELLRELKMSDFLERAVCLQLFCAGEKLNIRSSKVILVRYNKSVQNLLGVQTFVMNI